jgi:hypothetical protein
MPTVSDDFNRANGALGANWTAAFEGPPTIVSNATVGPTNNADEAAFWSAASFDADHYSEADTTLGGDTSWVGVVARLTATQGYVAVWATNSGGQYRLYRVTSSGGSWVQLGIVNSVGTTGTRRLRVEAEGTTITMFVDSTQQIQVTDSAITSGSPGIYHFWLNSTGTLDNFDGGDLAVSHVPQNLVATTFNASRIDLTWDAVAVATAYEIERDGVVIVSDHPTTSYSDTGLSAATEYDYQVRSVL